MNNTPKTYTYRWEFYVEARAATAEENYFKFVHFLMQNYTVEMIKKALAKSNYQLYPGWASTISNSPHPGRLRPIWRWQYRRGGG